MTSTLLLTSSAACSSNCSRRNPCLPAWQDQGGGSPVQRGDVAWVALRMGGPFLGDGDALRDYSVGISVGIYGPVIRSKPIAGTSHDILFPLEEIRSDVRLL